MVSSAFCLGSASKCAVLLLLLGQAFALRTTPGSPCENTCSPSNDTLPSEIVCLDAEYNSTDVGRKFQNCVECQLQSTFSDDFGQTDVEWGLYNLRFAFSSCSYGFPESVSNISSSCTVACEDLEPALEYDLRTPNGQNFDTWCGTTSFADNEVNDCGRCYNLTGNEPNSQVYMANFIESLRYNCHFETPTEEIFPIAPSRIFSTEQLPSSTADLISPSSSGSDDNLALIIAMPILGFVIFLCLLALGCFFFIRSRRKKARRLRQPGHLHARWNDTSISTPQWAMESTYPAQAQGMYSPAIYSPQAVYSPQPEYAPGFGFGFVDNDGRGSEIGYSKVVEPVIASPSTVYSPEEKVPPPIQTYFPPPPPPMPMQGNGKMKAPE
ncbi:hypothetical protein BJY04DRAFT_180034 [Aspergillus karnatakaensis]|uniref:uncharacterized protein n=1 Tax=Aspergillus karnatakaensis TaxID=1810916 RepID=UPI003CCD4409